MDNIKSKEDKKNNTFLPKKKINFFIYIKLYKLFLNNFFKSFAGPFFTFGLPLFFLILFYYTLGQSNSDGLVSVDGHNIIGGYILLSSVASGFNFLSNRIIEWKNSIFLKRIDVTPLKKWQFLFSIVTFYSFICLLGTIWMIIWSIIINPHEISNWSKYSNWGYMILGIITNIIVSISLSIIVAGFIRSQGTAEGIVMLIYFPSVFLSGMIIPISAFSGSSLDVINIIGYFLPNKYSSSVFMYGWWYSGKTLVPEIYQWANNWGFSHLWQPLLGAYGISFLFLGISSFTFKW